MTTTTTNTKHSSSCNMTFGRKDPTCPRCQELLSGSPPRTQPWRETYRRWNTQKLEGIKNHSCKDSGCGPCCTFGDW